MENNKKINSCCEPANKNGAKKGFWPGLLMGLLPHSACLLFIIFTILGTTALSAFFKPLLANRFSFYALIIFSLILTTIAAFIYLKKNGALSQSGLKRKWKYLLTLYGVTVAVNLALMQIIFPALANWRVGVNASASLTETIKNNSQFTLKVDIPCAGHSFLIIQELKSITGVNEAIFRAPDVFDVYYDALKISPELIMSDGIFKEFPARII
jgi:hypothetical protein